jgi:D-tyrosyl-tRNA(Tyr) deacylase
VVQRVRWSRVSTGERTLGEIGAGALVLLGIERGDVEADLDAVARRVVDLRMFADDAGRMNRSLSDTGGALLVVSQFTLCADLSKGRRPSFDAAEEPARAALLVAHFVAALRALGCTVATGEFGASMCVELANDGPVTFVLESRRGPNSRT